MTHLCASVTGILANLNGQIDQRCKHGEGADEPTDGPQLCNGHFTLLRVDVLTTAKFRSAAQRIGRSAAWHRPPTVAENPRVDAEGYQTPFETRCATAAAAPS